MKENLKKEELNNDYDELVVSKIKKILNSNISSTLALISTIGVFLLMLLDVFYKMSCCDHFGIPPKYFSYDFKSMFIETFFKSLAWITMYLFSYYSYNIFLKKEEEKKKSVISFIISSCVIVLLLIKAKVPEFCCSAIVYGINLQSKLSSILLDMLKNNLILVVIVILGIIVIFKNNKKENKKEIKKKSILELIKEIIISPKGHLFLFKGFTVVLMFKWLNFVVVSLGGYFIFKNNINDEYVLFLQIVFYTIFIFICIWIFILKKNKIVLSKTFIIINILCTLTLSGYNRIDNIIPKNDKNYEVTVIKIDKKDEQVVVLSNSNDKCLVVKYEEKDGEAIFYTKKYYFINRENKEFSIKNFKNKSIDKKTDKNNVTKNLNNKSKM